METPPTAPAVRPPAGAQHVAIIMDGNGRWAKLRDLPRAAGHRAGMEALRRIVRACPDLGVKILTVYGFSTENWRRPPDEVDALMGLLVEYLASETEELRSQGVRITTIGDMAGLPPLSQEALRRSKEQTAGQERLILNLALNYGGRHEIVRAVQRLVQDVEAGTVIPRDINEAQFARYLDTAGLPDPDLLIRSSGEERLSNFLLWQLAYTEIFVTPVLWPDFDASHLAEALTAFQRRNRRYGGVQ